MQFLRHRIQKLLESFDTNNGYEGDFLSFFFDLPRPRGSNPKSPGRLHQKGFASASKTYHQRERKREGLVPNLPSSHGGGMLPGNQMGLSGLAAAARTVSDRVLAGAVYVLRLSLLPPKKEAFVAPTIDPLFWEL